MEQKSIKNILTVLFSVIFFLFILELGIRMSGKFSTLSEKTGNGFLSMFDVTHAGINDVHEPGKDIHISNSEFSYVHIIDSLGFRNHLSDSLSSYPILAFGDSFTEGLGAPQDSTWPNLLSNILETHVYNAGIMGSDPVYAYKFLRDHYFPFQPNQIIFAVNFSDITDIVVRGGVDRFTPQGRVRYHSEPWFMPMYHYSHSFRAFLHLILGYDYMFNSPSERDGHIQTALDVLAETFLATNEWCSQHNVTMKVFVHPVPQEYYMNLDRRLDFSAIDKLVLLLNTFGIDAVNLRPAFERKLQTPEEWKAVSWPIDGHFNSKGYEIMAQLMAENINDSSMVY